MRILLVRPYRNLKKAYAGTTVPINLLTLAGYARRAGHAVALKDYYLEPYGEDGLRECCAAFQPDMIGFSCCTPDVYNIDAIAAAAKRFRPGIITVAGGPQPSAEPLPTLALMPAIDYVVAGEGERALTALLAGTDPLTIPGVIGRQTPAERVVPAERVENLDEAPLPAIDLIDLHAYHGQPFIGFDRSVYRMAEVMSARACPAQCTFCCSHVVSGRKTRFRSAGHVLAEIDEYRRRFAINHVGFFDDTFTLNRPRLDAVMAGLRERGITWNCATRANAVTEELLRAMVAHGCRGIYFGVESGSDRILALLRKGQTVAQNRAAFAAAHAAGVRNITASVMLGCHPTETREELEQTMRLALELNPTYLQINILTPFPGTAIYDEMQQAGMLDPDLRYDDMSYFHDRGVRWRTAAASGDELLALQKQFYRRFYLRPGFALRHLLAIRSWAELRCDLRYGWSFVRDILRAGD
ncbi:MAG TPA: radical SAM protein [bacterium]|mgnify:CR=1 FL=1|nr:radical SAM protein [bacterium]